MGLGLYTVLMRRKVQSYTGTAAVEQLMRDGRKAIDDKDYALAGSLFRRAVDIDQGPDTRNWYGQTLLLADKPNEARDQFLAESAMRPSARVNLEIALACGFMGKFEEAFSYLKAASAPVDAKYDNPSMLQVETTSVVTLLLGHLKCCRIGETEKSRYMRELQEFQKEHGLENGPSALELRTTYFHRLGNRA